MFKKIFKREPQEDINQINNIDVEAVTQLVIEQNKKLITEFLESYIRTLARKHEQLIYKDDYGDYIYDDWFREIEKFTSAKMSSIKETLLSQVYFEFSKTKSAKQYNFTWQDYDTTYMMQTLINNAVYDYYGKQLNDLDNPENKNLIIDTSDPILFEKSVAKQFELFGWNASLTKGSGDQGADVIVTNDAGFTIIVQCKMYSQPVGNKAVQEVNSAVTHYGGNIGMVITNSSFTKSAKQLADSCNVILLHYGDIPAILESMHKEDE